MATDIEGRVSSGLASLQAHILGIRDLVKQHGFLVGINWDKWL